MFHRIGENKTEVILFNEHSKNNFLLELPIEECVRLLENKPSELINLLIGKGYSLKDLVYYNYL
jgi:hypothetical protein